MSQSKSREERVQEIRERHDDLNKASVIVDPGFGLMQDIHFDRGYLLDTVEALLVENRELKNELSATTSTLIPECGCSTTCGDLPEHQDHPHAVCRGLRDSKRKTGIYHG